MNEKLLEILKRAKEVDNRAKKFDNKVSQQGMPQTPQMNVVNESPMQMPMELPTRRELNVPVGSGEYIEMVKKSKLPPEIQKLMIENPIPQADMPGSFSMSDEDIRKINPNHGVTNNFVQTPQPNVINENYNSVSGIDESTIRKMIAQEIAKSLPSIVEKYFDKKMIQENINIWKSLKVRKQ